jgi:hypothetical protein
MLTLLILSDVHYAGAAEQARTHDYETRGVNSPLLRRAVRTYRHYVWLRDPFAHNHRLDWFLSEEPTADFVVANGDFSCDTAFVGVSDDAACASARECLAKLRAQFEPAFEPVMGDHELGKLSMVGRQGGMRLASWHRAVNDLGIKPFWRRDFGRYVLLGITSSLVGLPLYAPEILASETREWEELRKHHLREISNVFESLAANQRVILFSHDPGALPFLAREEAISQRVGQIEQTIIGHLHSPVIFWKTRWLAGMPRIGFLGNTPRRITAALQEARLWRPFNVRLCPSLAGIQLFKDGGFLRLELDPDARQPARFTFRKLPWSKAGRNEASMTVR